MRFLLFLAAISLVFLATVTASAETFQAPVGGKTLSLDGRVICPGSLGDWTADGGSAHPPTDEAAIGKSVEVRVAANFAGCAAVTAPNATLLTTGKWPSIDPASITIWIDDGRIELRGKGLRGAGLVLHSGAISSEEHCVAPLADGTSEKCVLPAPRGLTADLSSIALSLLPAAARSGDDVLTFDANGRRTAAADSTLRPARVLVTRLLPSDASLDLAGGAAAHITLVHPEAVSSVDCGAASCEIDGSALVVRRLQTVGASLSVRFRLSPRVAFSKGDTTDAAPTIAIPILSCAMSAPSGDAIRAVDDAKIVVRLDARCASDVSALRFSIGGRSADVLQVVADAGASLVVLRVGRLEGDEALVVATRSGSDTSVVGQVRVRTKSLPAPRASLVLADGREIDFIPQNQGATVRFVRDAGGGGVLDVLPIEGAVHVETIGTETTIKAEHGSGGFLALRFGYRVPALPGALSKVDLATITEAVQRPIHEASVSLPLMGKQPFAELLCADATGTLRRLTPGQAERVPFDSRDSCRLVLHREQLSEESGAQKLTVEIDVAGVDGSPRSGAHVTHSITLRPNTSASSSTEPRVVWIKGAVGHFDRVTIRVSQASDDDRPTSGGASSTDNVSVQWAYVTGTERARLYATTAIPTGLYRVSDRDHSGILTLNFGVVTRLTWLDSDGHEGFLGLEAGMMGVGLANDQSATGRSLTQAALVTGLGLSVPIANRSLATETSINLHAWYEYEVSRALGNGSGSPSAFVFGPSISIGNIGTNL